MNIVIENASSDSQYGYWMEPGGDLYPVDYEGQHEAAIDEIENRK